MKDQPNLSPEETLLALAIIDRIEPEEIPEFEPYDSGNAAEDDYQNGRARLRALFRLNCEDGLMNASHLLMAVGPYVINARVLLRQAVSSMQTVSVSPPEDIAPESGFVDFERSEIFRLITSRTDLSPGYLCEILTENDPQRDQHTEPRRPMGTLSHELHIPQWLLSEMLAAAKNHWLEMQTDRRFIWREPVDVAS